MTPATNADNGVGKLHAAHSLATVSPFINNHESYRSPKSERYEEAEVFGSCYQLPNKRIIREERKKSWISKNKKKTEREKRRKGEGNTREEIGEIGGGGGGGSGSW
ncbi:unnamed protein product [Cuscuta epithymum]|uniref:Uncharacterized protein n=1 Tax=Cuscuta epithymum TaxID=186058 RepID=A0AAV0CYS0_9ASTE|nr:unnamed protein product [Cuscuta epithymum]